jgi:hypothetical protein
MRRVRKLIPILALVLILLFVLIGVSLFVATRRPQRLPEYASPVGPLLNFEQVAEPGFDDLGRARYADSAWSMRYFQADGASSGYLYVGTDNNILGLTMAALRGRKGGDTDLPVQPPQLRRYRPDLGPQTWEVVLDYADHEQAPYLNEGFRSMGIYKSKADGRSYLYAGTMAAHNPEVWRSAKGEPGSWEKVFTFPDVPESKIGSIRGMVAHWATDGITFTRVITDGFGTPDNGGITSLASFNGCLYAGTYNPATGYEVWKLRCVSDLEAPPQPVIRGGAGQPHNEAVMSLRPFKDHLYLGTGIPLGFNPITRHGPRGCSVIRISPDDTWEVVVGQKHSEPLSEYHLGCVTHYRLSGPGRGERCAPLQAAARRVGRPTSRLGLTHGRRPVPHSRWRPLAAGLSGWPGQPGQPRHPYPGDNAGGSLRGHREPLHPARSLATSRPLMRRMS